MATSKRFAQKNGLTWKHVVLTVMVVWLIATLVVGERIQIDQIQFKGVGCSISANKMERATSGLPIRDQFSSKK